MQYPPIEGFYLHSEHQVKEVITKYEEHQQPDGSLELLIVTQFFFVCDWVPPLVGYRASQGFTPEMLAALKDVWVGWYENEEGRVVVRPLPART